jgi:hypothetical protein
MLEGTARMGGRLLSFGGLDDKPLWLNMGIGLLLSQGIYYGLRQLATAVVLASGFMDTAEWWNQPPGLLTSQMLLGLGLLAGGLVAGAGHRWGIGLGAGLGVVNGLLYLFGQFLFRGPLTAVEWYGQPIVQAAFGAVGAFLGSRIWNPRPVGAELPSLPTIPVPLVTTRPRQVEVPVNWPRVLGGVLIAIGGTLWADGIFQLVLVASDYTLAPQTRFQATFITWEIAQLALFVGGSWAGANSKNGLRQGWMMGLGTSLLLITIYLVSQERYTPVQAETLWLFGVGPGNLSKAVRTVILIVCNSVSLGVLGGWFGGSLLPPVLPFPRRRGYGPMAD